MPSSTATRSALPSLTRVTTGTAPVSSTADSGTTTPSRVAVWTRPSANSPAMSLPLWFGTDTKIDT